MNVLLSSQISLKYEILSGSLHRHRAGQESEQDEEYVELGIKIQSHSISIYSPQAWEVCDQGGWAKKKLT